MRREFFIYDRKRFLHTGENTIYEEMEKYPPDQLDNYNRNHFRQNGHIDEYPFLAIYLTAIQGASASYAGLVIAASSSVGILASFTADISRTNLAEKT